MGIGDVSLVLSALIQSATSVTCSSCTDRVNGSTCLSWNSVDCASIYGPKAAVCVFYPPPKNFTHLALREQDRYCMAEDRLKSIYDITLVGNGSCSVYGNNESAPYVCTCIGDICNSKADIGLWLDQITTTMGPAPNTTKKKCRCCCDEDTSSVHRNVGVVGNLLIVSLLYFSITALVT